MKQEDKLRNSLREYYDNQQAPFSDDEWDRAGAYLSAARRGRRIRSAAFIFVALVSALFITLFNFPASFSGKKNQALPLSEQRVKSEPARQPAALHTSLVLPSAVKSQSTSNSYKSVKQFNAAVFLSPDRKITPETTAGLAPVMYKQVFRAGRAVSGSEPHEQDKIANEENVSDTDPVAIPVPVLNNTADDNTLQDDLKNEAPADAKEIAATIPVEAIAHDQAPFLEKETPQVKADVLLPQAIPVAVNGTEKKTAATEAAVPAVVADTSRSASIAATTGTTEIAVADTLQEPASITNLVRDGIFYEAGAAWLYGWKGPVHRDARGFSPVVGINYMNRLSNRCAFSFGLQYLQVRNLSSSSKTSRVSSYTYGEQSSVTIITPSTVHYLLAPLRFHYSMDQRNSFGIGINLAYLLNVEATVTSYDERPGFTGNYKTVKLGGYTEGFSWFDSQLAFCYRRKIGSSFGLQAEIFIGLTDVKQDGFFGFSNKERNSGAKLTLIYYAFRKNSRR